MKKEESISNIYPGGTSSFSPTYGSASATYHTPAGDFGIGTDPRSANVLQEVSTKLASGVKQIEIAAVSPEIFDSMPQQQLKEVNRLSKLTGIDVSLHGPVIDTTGIVQQQFSETNREASERTILQTLKRSHDLNPNGNVPVNFHSAEGIPGSQLLPPKEREEGREAKRLIVVNRETGKMAPLDEEERFYPGGEVRKETLTPEKRVEILNHSEWDNSISQLIMSKERADEILQQNRPLVEHVEKALATGEIKPETLKHFPEQKKVWNHVKNAKAYLDDVDLQIRNLFSKAYEYSNKDQKKQLKILSDTFKKDLDQNQGIFGQAEAMHELLHGLKKSRLAPEMHIPIEEFAVDQSSKTFGNAAFESFKKFKDKSPILLIENPPAGFALSTGEDLKKLVKESRNKFIERAKKEGLSEKEARNQAEKLIGATWDVGHINMLRKQGYEEKDIIKETEAIAPVVKHVHLSDNFGFEHTELPMGMGNVPLKEIMDKLGKKGFEAKKIIEAGQWWQHFKTPPIKETMEAMGSPIYSVGMSPYWNQSIGLQQGYFGGYGEMLPQKNYETFGAGFAQLPGELGGQVQRAGGSRVGGTPME